jgi:hypothetical protein
MSGRLLLALLFALLFALTAVMQPGELFAQDGSGVFGITVVQGQNGTIDETHTVDVVVRVPVAGASVTFKLSAATGVSFPGGATQVTVKSDAQGMARSGILSSTGKGGAFEVEIQAAYESKAASAVIHETNATGGATGFASATHKSHTKVWVAIAGAGAAGALLAATKKGANSGSSAPTVVTVTAGSPSIGPPQ